MLRTLKLNWTLAPELPFLDGHFPGQPTLPGFAIIDESLRLLREEEADLPKGFVVNNAKFSRPIVPGQSLHISAEKNPSAGNRWTVRWSDSTTHDELVLLDFAFG